MGEVTDELPAFADPERGQRSFVARVDQRLDPSTAAAARELLVLLAQTATGAKQGALDHRPAHPEPPADLAVGESLELAEDEHAVVALHQPAEGSTQVVEPLLGLDRHVRRGRMDEHVARRR